MSLEHYLTYQHNVQRLFHEHADKYHGAIIPLSIAMSFPTGTYGFIRGLCTFDKDKRYAIDPRTPLFQKNWDRARFVRGPHQKMAGALGGPFWTVGLSRPLTPADFATHASREEAVEACLHTQREFRTREEETKKLKKYRLMLGLDALDPLREPQFLIPPYFQIERHGDEWYELCVDLVRRAQAHAHGVPLRPVIHFRVWGQMRWGGLASALKECGVKDVFLYPNDFREHEQGVQALREYVKAVSTLRAEGLRPFALHGGYFSMAASLHGLQGFGNGVGYGEWRDSGYHRGGAASVRIYVPKLHRFVSAVEAQALVDADRAYFASDSDLLDEYAAAGRPLTDVTTAESWDHILDCRKVEMDFLEGASISDVRSELRATYRALQPIPPDFGVRFGRSLLRWGRALR